MKIHGDCIEEMQQLEANSAHGLVTDPPYNLDFMGKKWDKFGTPRKYQRWCRTWGMLALRLLKPGAFGLIFGGTRTHHRLTAGLEDAGFEIRDEIKWIYVSGFPKGPDLSTAIDEHFGLERERGPMRVAPDGVPYSLRQLPGHLMTSDEVYGKTVVNKDRWYTSLPNSDEAKQWNGYKTLLKPAWEPIILVRKPKQGTYVENILEWGVGGLNIDACRIPINLKHEKDSRFHNQEKNIMRTTGVSDGGSTKFFEKSKKEGGYVQQLFDLKGRFPTNVIIDELISEVFDEISGVEKPRRLKRNIEVNRKNKQEGLFSKENSGYYKTTSTNKDGISNYGDGGGMSKSFYTCPTTDVVYGKTWAKRSAEHYGLKDGGGLGKWFYVPKASAGERNVGLGDFEEESRDTTRTKPIDNPFNRNKPVKNKHPTVKPIRLMTYLVRLIKPPVSHPVILEPFGGSGSTYIACLIENCDCIYIERNQDYIDILNARLDVPLEDYSKYTDSPIPVLDERQSKITDFSSWL